jgi:flagellar biosynthesis/type III secretory pathway chaperone
MNASISACETDWFGDLADLLGSLSATQDELLVLLAEKRQLLVAADQARLAALVEREDELIDRLRECQQRRTELLDRAEREGRPAESLQALTASMPDSRQQRALRERFEEAEHRFRLLEHHSLTNWLLVQRTLIHLSQLLEIIATGGRLQPTYGKGAPDQASGSLVDQAA